MKKFISLLFMLVICVSIYAQKSYVTVYCCQDGNTINLSGAIPSTMKDQYSPSDFTSEYKKQYGYFCIGEVLNLLADNGFSVEQMNSVRGNYTYTTYLLSKSGSSSVNKIERVSVDNDEEVTEIARYNLQGIPVKEADKGLQIIVYSNYTTKVVIVE